MTIRTGHIAVLACMAALVAAGCGSSDEPKGPGVPQATVDEIDTQLASLSERVDVRIPGACADAQEENIPAIQQQVAGLPADTDPDIRSALSESVDKLSTLLDSECQDIADQADREKQETTTTETTPTETQTQTETTPQTETQTTVTTPEENKDQKKEKKPKEQDNGGSNSDDQQDSGGATPE